MHENAQFTGFVGVGMLRSAQVQSDQREGGTQLVAG
jgi:hypothetical protein